MRNRKFRSVGMIAGASIFGLVTSVAACGSAAAADLPVMPPQAQVAPPPRYAPAPNYPGYGPPPVAEDEAYPPPVAYGYAPPPPPAYYAYAPPPVVVLPRPYYWGPNYYWGRPSHGPFIAGGYGRYERPYGRFPERAWGRRGW
jgi:hypothetical protein